MTGRYFHIQRYSIHDGPGIRTTVFLQGCPLSCPWCHNPESRPPEPQVRVIEARCIRCGECAEACPVVRSMGSDRPRTLPLRLPPGRCTACGRCVDACPSQARLPTGRPIEVSELIAGVERDLPFYEESGGGVTFSGGEPLLQPAFLLECLIACRARGIPTAVDTSGYAPREAILDVAAQTDLFLFDLKVLDAERHRSWTGVPVEAIIGNLRALDEKGVAVWLRVPVVPGWNDRPGDLEAIGGLAAGLRGIRRIHLLPYHRMAAEKYRSIGRSYPLADMKPPPLEKLEQMAMRLSSFGLDVHVGG